MIEYTINEFLTLKLEDGKTYIYINGKKFLQCKRLMINILEQDIPNYDEIDSIDEAADMLKLSLWQNRIVEGPMARPSSFQNETITPEQEFWGHCSNIQTWYEHDYDTRLLHSNLAFPLLKILVDVGDTKATKMLKTEIMERLESRHPNVIRSILLAGLLDYLSPEERRQIIQLNVSIILSHIESILKYCPNLFLCVFKEKLLDYLDPEEKEQLLRTNYQAILTFLQKISGFYPKTILDILEEISQDHPGQAELRQLIQKSFPVILKDIEIILKDIERIWKDHPKLFLYFFEERLLNYLINKEKSEIVQHYYPIIFKKGQEKKSFILKNFPSVIEYLEEITVEFEVERISETTISIIYATIIDDIKGTKLLDDFFNAIANRYQLRSFIVIPKAIRSIKTSEDNQNDIWKKWKDAWKKRMERREKEREEWRVREKERRERARFPAKDKLSLKIEIEEIDVSRQNKTKCKYCLKVLPSKSISILIRMKRVYCPYCGKINHSSPLFKKDLNKIFSLFQEQGTDKITFQRQYLPEILSPDSIKISENDGLPIIYPFVIEIFRMKGIRIIFTDNEAQFLDERKKKM